MPIPERSASPRATSTLEVVDSLKVLDPDRPIREADIDEVVEGIRSGHSVLLEAAGELYAIRGTQKDIRRTNEITSSKKFHRRLR